MKKMEMTRQEAQEKFDSYMANGIPNDFLNLDEREAKIRKDILDFAKLDLNNYDFDLDFALKLYQYFNINSSQFDEVKASNYKFWYYLSLNIVPDLVAERHGLVDSYFYSKNVRVYLATMWWFIHMSWQGDVDTTRECLKNGSTDLILQLVERPGRSGMYLDVCREIIRQISEYSKTHKGVYSGNNSFFRRIMKLNTAQIDNYNLVVEGKAKEYVESLLKTCEEKNV